MNPSQHGTGSPPQPCPRLHSPWPPQHTPHSHTCKPATHRPPRRHASAPLRPQRNGRAGGGSGGCAARRRRRGVNLLGEAPLPPLPPHPTSYHREGHRYSPYHRLRPRFSGSLARRRLRVLVSLPCAALVPRASPPPCLRTSTAEAARPAPIWTRLKRQRRVYSTPLPQVPEAAVAPSRRSRRCRFAPSGASSRHRGCRCRFCWCSLVG